MGFKSSRNSRIASKSNDRDDRVLADDFADALLAGHSPWLDDTRLDEAAVYAAALHEVISEGQELELRGPRTDAEKDRLERLVKAVKPIVSALSKSRVFKEKTRRITDTALAAEYDRLYSALDEVATQVASQRELHQLAPTGTIVRQALANMPADHSDILYRYPHQIAQQATAFDSPNITGKPKVSEAAIDILAASRGVKPSRIRDAITHACNLAKGTAPREHS